jgi:DNA repair exonuclease SbcCD nuclease subunit
MKKQNSFRFIHAADLHIDSPFKGITVDNKSIGDALRAATFDAFNALIDLCIQKQVQFLLVAGDIYDGADRSLLAQLKFRDGLVRLAEHNINAFVVHGNHDPMNSQSAAIEWPDKVHIFGSNKVESKTAVRQDGMPMALISGISHANSNETQNLTRKFSREDPGIFHIGLLHCNVGSNTGHDPYAPCELSDLTYTGMDYWALGHVHEKAILNTNPYVVYAGNTQGRNIREQAERGCWLVTVEDRHVSDIQFCPVDAVRWFRINVSIDSIDTVDKLERAIWKSIQELMENHSGSRAVVLRVSITGNGPLYNELQKDNAVLDLLDRTRDAFASEDPFVWVQEIEADCRPEIDLNKLKQQGNFLSQVIKIAETVNDPSTNISETLKPVLSDLFENSKVKKSLEKLSQDEMSKIIEKSVLFCVNMLEGSE